MSKTDDESLENFSVDAVWVDKVYLTCTEIAARVTFCEGIVGMPDEMRARSAIMISLANLANLGAVISQVLKNVEEQKTERAKNNNVIPIVPTPQPQQQPLN